MLKSYRVAQLAVGTIQLSGILMLYGTGFLEKIKSLSFSKQVLMFIVFSYLNIGIYFAYSRYFAYKSFKKKYQGYDIHSISTMIKGIQERNVKIK